MKVSLYWPECTLQRIGEPSEVYWDAPARTVFWVEATIQEAAQNIRPHMTTGRLEYERMLSLPPDVQADEMFDDRFCFLVSQNFDLVAWCFRIYPYSAMWGRSGSPFRVIGKSPAGKLTPDGVQITSLSALRNFIPPVDS
jgi:hypothetical protein